MNTQDVALLGGIAVIAWLAYKHFKSTAAIPVNAFVGTQGLVSYDPYTVSVQASLGDGVPIITSDVPNQL